MRNEGVGSWMERRARMSGADAAIVFEGQTLSYTELAIRCRRLAHLLHRLDITKGDRIAYLGHNHPSALEALFACGLVGATYVPINARLTGPEIAYILADSGARLVLHGKEFGEILATIGGPPNSVEHRYCVEASDGRDDCYEQAMESGPADVIDDPVSLDDLCVLMYTSGTTGNPKGVVLTHGNMTWNAINQMIGQNITGYDRTLAVAPLFHIGGLGGSVTATLMHGGTVVLARRFEPKATLNLILRERVTTLFAVPTMIDLLSRQTDFAQADLSCLRMITVAGAPVPESLIAPWADRGVAIQQAYGMTETAPSGTLLSAADAARKRGSAGQMCFFTDVKVVDAQGAEASSGEVGEVLLQGPNVMIGYWNQPETSSLALRDGWMHTGDAGVMDSDGFLYIRDRFKDMYISGGENVYPAEVENALIALPDVAEAAVIGVADSRWGETGCAFIVKTAWSRSNEEQVVAALGGSLARFKIPKEFHFVDELPRNGAGKVNKNALRSLAVVGSALVAQQS
jgi:fatty-acyl-CoA synthase